MGSNMAFDWFALAGALAPFAGVADLIAPPLAAVILVAGWWFAQGARQRRARLLRRFDYVSAQLERLYGPLYALVTANDASYDAYRKIFPAGEPPRTPEEARAMRAWAEHVFIPANLRMRAVIEANTHLLRDGVMPDCFVRLIAHAESATLTLALLDTGEGAMLEAFVAWPKDLAPFVRDAYFNASAEHGRLRAALGLRSSRRAARS